MNGNVFKSVKETVKYWWISLLLGVLGIVVGIWCLTTPDKSLVAMVYVFVASFFIGGILDLVFAVANRKEFYGWGWHLIGGILEILMGILLLTLPLPFITMILIYLVGFWMMFRALSGIGESCQLQMLGVRGWGWMLAFSILALIFSFLYLLSPVFGGVFIVVFISLALLSYGIFRVALAFKLRSVYKNVKEIE